MADMTRLIQRFAVILASGALLNGCGGGGSELAPAVANVPVVPAPKSVPTSIGISVTPAPAPTAIPLPTPATTATPTTGLPTAAPDSVETLRRL
jgi:hypothetical protein